jgi:Skp family chaperone for outer membrane proteins
MKQGARIVLGALIGMACAASSLNAQAIEKYHVFEDTPLVVSVNREGLIQGSEFGKALINSLSEQQSALVLENETFAKDLEREELELTELRKTLSAEEFGPLAEAFDVKVKEVRRVQDEKTVALAKSLEAARFRFFRQAERLIGQLMQDNGIVFVLDEGAVWLSRGGDVTNLVIERLDAAYASGQLALE